MGIIGVDLDGCVFNCDQVLLDKLNAKNNTSYTPLDITAYDMISLNVKAGQKGQILKEMDEEKLWETMEVYPTVKDALTKVSGRHTVIAITCRWDDAAVQGRLAIKNNELPITEVIRAADGDDKIRLIKEKGCLVYIEDRPDYVMKMVDAGLRVICMAHAYNKNILSKAQQSHNLIYADTMDLGFHMAAKLGWI